MWPEVVKVAYDNLDTYARSCLYTNEFYEQKKSKKDSLQCVLGELWGVHWKFETEVVQLDMGESRIFRN